MLTMKSQTLKDILKTVQLGDLSFINLRDVDRVVESVAQDNIHDIRAKIESERLESYEIKKLELLLKYGFKDYVGMINDSGLRKELLNFQKLLEEKDRTIRVAATIYMLMKINKINNFTKPTSEKVEIVREALRELETKV